MLILMFIVGMAVGFLIGILVKLSSMKKDSNRDLSNVKEQLRIANIKIRNLESGNKESAWDDVVT